MFPRDPQFSAQVWSSEFGYPGDGRYREFYRDIGFDIDSVSLNLLRLPDRERRAVGLKYPRVTGQNVPLGEKEPYHRGWALEAVEEHVENFVSSITARIDHAYQEMDRTAVIVTPYDAELFGHWWFEGPEFLDAVVRKLAGSSPYRLSSPTDVLESGLRFQLATPEHSSWGAYGYSDSWLNDRNDWIWPHLHNAASETARLPECSTI